MIEVPARSVSIWRRLLPFVIAAALITVIVARVSFADFEASVAHTNLAAFIAFAAACTGALLVADCIASVVVYRTLVGPISLRELLVLRGASYLPGLLNHNVGQAWLTYAIARACNAPILRVGGATLLVYATTMACVFGLGGVSLALAPHRFGWLGPMMLAVGIGAVAYTILLAAKPAWFVRARLTAPLAEAGVRGHLVALAWRIPHIVVLFLGTWLPFAFFGISIPLADALALVPPLMVLVALPITPQGLGTRDAFAVQVFAVYALGTATERTAAVAAATLCWAVALTLVQIPISLVFVRVAARKS